MVEVVRGHYLDIVKFMYMGRRLLLKHPIKGSKRGTTCLDAVKCYSRNNCKISNIPNKYKGKLLYNNNTLRVIVSSIVKKLCTFTVVSCEILPLDLKM